MALGVLSFLSGIMCLRSPLQTAGVLTLVLGASWLIREVVDIVVGISRRGEDGRGWTIDRTCSSSFPGDAARSGC